MGVRRLVGVLVTGAACVLMLTAAAALACVTPPKVNLSTASGRPGDVVAINGELPNAASVQIRWGGPDGPVVGETQSDEAGQFTTTFTVPEGQPGFYVVAAVAEGLDSSVHGRALFEVRGAQSMPATAPPTVGFTPSTDSSASSFPIAVTATLGVVGLLLFAGGFVAVTRNRRSAGVAPARVRD